MYCDKLEQEERERGSEGWYREAALAVWDEMRNGWGPREGRPRCLGLAWPWGQWAEPSRGNCMGPSQARQLGGCMVAL